jgi:hypothetical protein
VVVAAAVAVVKVAAAAVAVAATDRLPDRLESVNFRVH